MATAGAAQTPAARGRLAPGHRFAWASEPAVLFLIAALLASAAVLLFHTREITFLLDDWTLLLYRPGLTADSVFEPHNEHILVAPVLIYKALLALFGMDSARPFQVASIATFLVSVVALFAWLRPRVGDWAALGAAILILFCGAAWEDLLWSFQIGYFGSMASGLGALVALRRESPAADRVACLLLVICFSFSSLAIPFAVAAAVAIATGPGWRRRAYLLVIPVGLYGLWWLGWGHTAENHVSLHNLAAAPLYVFDSIAAGISSLLGLATPRDESGVGSLDWGRPLAALAIALAALRVYRLGSVPRWLWVVGALAFSYWLLAALNLAPGRDATASRYQYVGAIFLLLIAAELVRGLRIATGAIAAGAVVIALAVISNLSFLDQSAASYERTSDLIGADLAAVEIARDSVDPNFVLIEALAGTPYVSVAAGTYLAAVDEFGSPADDPQELAAAPEEAREAADRVLAGALGLRVTPRPGPASGGECQTLDAGSGQAVAVGPGEVTVSGSPSTRAKLRLGRFATGYPIGAGEVADGTVGIAIPADRSSVPWQLQLDGRGEVVVCAAPAPAAGG